jgi:hypothetical protein
MTEPGLAGTTIVGSWAFGPGAVAKGVVRFFECVERWGVA